MHLAAPSYEVSKRYARLGTVDELSQVRWGDDWERDDGSNTTWVSSKDVNNEVFHQGRAQKFERTLSVAAAKKAKVSTSIDLDNIMLAWPHDRATAERAEAWEEKLEIHRRRHASGYTTNGHFLMDWDHDIVRLSKNAPEPLPDRLPDRQRHSSLRSESRTLSDAGTPQPTRAPASRPARQSKNLSHCNGSPLTVYVNTDAASLRSESNASTLRPDSHGKCRELCPSTSVTRRFMFAARSSRTVYGLSRHIARARARSRPLICENRDEVSESSRNRMVTCCSGNWC